MDRRLTAYVLKYLLEHRFESKAEMARQLGMRQRTIEKVFANLDVAKAGTIAFDKAIYQTTSYRSIPPSNLSLLQRRSRSQALQWSVGILSKEN